MTKRGRPRKKDVEDKETHWITRDPTMISFKKQRNIKPSTLQGYHSALRQYADFHGYNNLQEIIDEALEDEKNRVPIKESRLKKRLDEYQEHLRESFSNDSTVHTYFSKLETFLRHHQVTVPQRPPMKINADYHVSYFDLPTNEMIEEAVNQSTPLMKAIILFMSSSGTAKTETLSLTVGMFLEGLREYCTLKDPKEVVEKLVDRNDLVPVIFLTRVKTNTPYYTCCSPEATQHILKYLKLRVDYTRDSQLFPMSDSLLMTRFQELNDSNNWGWVGSYRRFRTHTLRKFHASNLGCHSDLIDSLEGRQPNKVHATYMKQNPEKLKEEYMEYMHNVMIHPEKYVGPHCGELMLDNGDVVIPEQIKTVLQEILPNLKQASQPDVQLVNPAMENNSYNFELIKEIGMLESKIEQLEEQLKIIPHLQEHIELLEKQQEVLESKIPPSEF